MKKIKVVINGVEYEVDSKEVHIEDGKLTVNAPIKECKCNHKEKQVYLENV